MRLQAAGISVTGPAHLQDDLPNQDALMVRGCRGGWCVAVCDGLGSRALSHLGSARAGQLVHLQASQHPAGTALELSLSVRSQWLASFTEDYRQYETTCLWAQVDQQGRGRCGQTGDGLLLLQTGGQFQVMTREKSGFGNQTTTLAQAGAAEDWALVSFRLSQAGDGVVLMTDGISDDLLPDQLPAFFAALYQRQRTSSRRQMRSWLRRELLEWSTPMHGDDKTIATLFRMD